VRLAPRRCRMTNLDQFLRLLAETESILTRESETILTGKSLDGAEASRKTALVGRLVQVAPEAGHIAHASDADGRRQLREGFERMLQAAARNEAILRGALRGARMIASALQEGTAAYAAGQPQRRAPTLPLTNHVNRLA
jgi:hypothetical protein